MVGDTPCAVEKTYTGENVSLCKIVSYTVGVSSSIDTVPGVIRVTLDTHSAFPGGIHPDTSRAG